MPAIVGRIRRRRPASQLRHGILLRLPSSESPPCSRVPAANPSPRVGLFAAENRRRCAFARYCRPPLSPYFHDAATRTHAANLRTLATAGRFGHRRPWRVLPLVKVAPPRPSPPAPLHRHLVQYSRACASSGRFRPLRRCCSSVWPRPHLHYWGLLSRSW
jgi:hypothetical protein